MNGIHRAYRHRMHWLSSLRSYFYACDVSSENKTWCFFSHQKSHRWALGGGEGLTKKCTANEFVQSCFQDCFLCVLYIKKIVPCTFFCVCQKIFHTNCTDSHLRGLLYPLLYVTVLKIYISNYGYLFGTATYVDYLTFSHLNPITNQPPCLTQP